MIVINFSHMLGHNEKFLFDHSIPGNNFNNTFVYYNSQFYIPSNNILVETYFSPKHDNRINYFTLGSV